MVFDQHVCMWFASSSGAFGQYFNLELSLTLLTQISMYGNDLEMYGLLTIIYVRIKVGKYSSPIFHVGLWWLWFSRFPGPTEKGCHCNPWNILGMTPVSSLSQGRTTGYRGCRAVSFFNVGQSFPTKRNRYVNWRWVRVCIVFLEMHSWAIGKYNHVHTQNIQWHINQS